MSWTIGVVSCIALTRLDFNRVLGPLKDILSFRKYEDKGAGSRKEPTPDKKVLPLCADRKLYAMV